MGCNVCEGNDKEHCEHCGTAQPKYLILEETGEECSYWEAGKEEVDKLMHDDPSFPHYNIYEVKQRVYTSAGLRPINKE